MHLVQQRPRCVLHRRHRPPVPALRIQEDRRHTRLPLELPQLLRQRLGLHRLALDRITGLLPSSWTSTLIVVSATFSLVTRKEKDRERDAFPISWLGSEPRPHFGPAIHE